jgi:hypothetical protein
LIWAGVLYNEKEKGTSAQSFFLFRDPDGNLINFFTPVSSETNEKFTYLPFLRSRSGTKSAKNQKNEEKENGR